MGTHLHPLAYQRELERLDKLARLAEADHDAAQARRLRKLARYYAHTAQAA